MGLHEKTNSSVGMFWNRKHDYNRSRTSSSGTTGDRKASTTSLKLGAPCYTAAAAAAGGMKRPKSSSPSRRNRSGISEYIFYIGIFLSILVTVSNVRISGSLTTSCTTITLESGGASGKTNDKSSSTTANGGGQSILGSTFTPWKSNQLQQDARNSPQSMTSSSSNHYGWSPSLGMPGGLSISSSSATTTTAKYVSYDETNPEAPFWIRHRLPDPHLTPNVPIPMFPTKQQLSQNTKDKLSQVYSGKRSTSPTNGNTGFKSKEEEAEKHDDKKPYQVDVIIGILSGRGRKYAQRRYRIRRLWKDELARLAIISKLDTSVTTTYNRTEADNSTTIITTTDQHSVVFNPPLRVLPVFFIGTEFCPIPEEDRTYPFKCVPKNHNYYPPSMIRPTSTTTNNNSTKTNATQPPKPPPKPHALEPTSLYNYTLFNATIKRHITREEKETKLLLKEAEIYRDIALLNVQDFYHNSPVKVATFLAWVTNQTTAQYVMKMDDDVFMDWRLHLTRFATTLLEPSEQTVDETEEWGLIKSTTSNGNSDSSKTQIAHSKGNVRGGTRRIIQKSPNGSTNATMAAAAATTTKATEEATGSENEIEQGRRALVEETEVAAEASTAASSSINITYIPTLHINRTTNTLITNMNKKNKYQDRFIWWGNLRLNTRPSRDDGDRWGITQTEFPNDHASPYMSGVGSMLDVRAAEFLASNYRQLHHRIFGEDLALGEWLSGTNIEYVHDAVTFPRHPRKGDCNASYSLLFLNYCYVTVSQRILKTSPTPGRRPMIGLDSMAASATSTATKDRAKVNGVGGTSSLLSASGMSGWRGNGGLPVKGGRVNGVTSYADFDPTGTKSKQRLQALEVIQQRYQERQQSQLLRTNKQTKRGPGTSNASG